MKLRVARHTQELNRITDFYGLILGLVILGEFRDHQGYSGVFLGKPGSDWHLEFTVSADAPVHQPDEDDLLVFYMESSEEFAIIKKRLADNKIIPVTAKNPYWLKNGVIFPDPEGYLVVISLVRN